MKFLFILVSDTERGKQQKKKTQGDRVGTFSMPCQVEIPEEVLLEK